MVDSKARQRAASVRRWVPPLFAALWVALIAAIYGGLEGNLPQPDLRPLPDPSVVAAYREQSVRVGSVWSGRSYRYRLLEPPVVAEGRRYPLLIYLHGAGGRGDDNQRQLRDLPSRMLEREYRRRYPCFVLVPQCPRGTDWADYTLQRHDNDEVEGTPVVLAIVEHVLESRPIDSERVYLTGFSLGAFGTWRVAARRPDLFAAIVPVCGGGSPEDARRLDQVPIWAVHGRMDDVIPSEHTQTTVDAVRAAGGAPHYTEVGDAGHSSDWAYDLRNGVLEWMFAQRRNQ